MSLNIKQKKATYLNARKDSRKPMTTSKLQIQIFAIN